MQRKFDVYIIFITFAILIVILYIVSNNTWIKMDNYSLLIDADLYSGEKNIECLYYNIADFMNIEEYDVWKNREDDSSLSFSIPNLNDNEDKCEGTVRGLIVPHHLLAEKLIHEAFQSAGNSEYSTVVIFGPDHESIDRGKVFTTMSNWQTPMGILKADKKAAEYLLSLDFVLENDEKMTIEHSISSLVPFIKYYFCDAKIIPIALTKQLTYENLTKLIKTLINNIEIENTLFISSVDFSHYLSSEDAYEMDRISIAAIKNRDIKTIMKFTNDNLDSPNSIAAMLMVSNLTGADSIKMINNSNSQTILNKKVEETTSYITFMFYNENR